MNPAQGQRTVVGSSTEAINSDAEAVSPVNSQTLNNVLDPADPRFANHTVPASGSSFPSSTHNVQSFGWWSFGQPGSRLVSAEQRNDNLTEMEMGAPDNIHADSGYSSHGGNQIRTPPLSLGGPSYNQIPEAAHLNADIASRIDNRQNSGAIVYPNNGQSLSQGCIRAREDNSGGSGSSCKRMALEGASGHTFPGWSSSCYPHAESSIWHAESSQHQASSSYSLPTRLQNIPTSGQPTRRSNLGQQQESVPSDLSAGENLNQELASSPYVDSMDVRSTRQDSSNSGVNNIIHHPALTRNIHQLARGMLFNLRISASTITVEERLEAPWEGTNMRTAARNNTEHHMFVSENERNPVPNHSIWGSTGGNHGAPINPPFGIRAGTPIPSTQYLQPPAVWIPHQNTSLHISQRIPELPPWFVSASVGSEPAIHGGASSLLPSGPAISFPAAAVPARSNNRSSRSRPRRSGNLWGRQNDDLSRLRQLRWRMATDVNRRHHLISEMPDVLRAMHRTPSLRVEGNMAVNPHVPRGRLEIHDRHRDMRLDVDNMSYEELLALGERIGEVNVGLSEEIILKTMKQRRYASCNFTESQQEPCCICQEEYSEEDEVGSLDCNHDFHTGCIKEWLKLKNICPICKTTGLSQ